MASTKAKYLFITHDAGLYGASKSLQLLLSRFGAGEVDLIVARRPFRKAFDEATVRARFGPAVNGISFFHVPLDYCYRGQPGPFIIRRAYEALLKLLWTFERYAFRRRLSGRDYAYIHLNSLTLHRMITGDRRWILHVREIVDRPAARIVRSLEQAHGVIFVDQTTFEPFRSARFRCHAVIPNPIDMRPAEASAAPLSGLPFDPSGHTVFSMIGKITADKGTRFVITAFRRLRNDRARLLIVGSGDDADEIAACKAAAAGDPRVLFWGEEPDILRIYRISDYILRGEPYPCVGRTVYEGLYAGSGVIIPAGPDGIRDLLDDGPFAGRVHSYAPRSEAELVAKLQALSAHKIGDRTYRSNADEYAARFESFVRTALGDGPCAQNDRK